ncbi:hypothetical protein PENTCL1PPCAC_21233, partial [Pristionchus entomophagus]
SLSHDGRLREPARDERGRGRAARGEELPLVHHRWHRLRSHQVRRRASRRRPGPRRAGRTGRHRALQRRRSLGGCARDGQGVRDRSAEERREGRDRSVETECQGILRLLQGHHDLPYMDELPHSDGRRNPRLRPLQGSPASIVICLVMMKYRSPAPFSQTPPPFSVMIDCFAPYSERSICF